MFGIGLSGPRLKASRGAGYSRPWQARAWPTGAFHLAAWSHAELIRIHPFEDGNGRCGRLLMDWVLIRLGLRPVPVEVVKAEYLACLNEYFLTKDLQPLIDLLLRIYPA